MMKKMLILLATLLPLTAIADEGDCLYNPEAFRDMLGQLRSQYAKSKYTEGNDAVVIHSADGTVTVSYGGCEYYRTEISYVAVPKKAYPIDEAFAKSVELVRQFGRDRVDPKVLGKLLGQRKYEEIQPGTFSVSYPGMVEFTIEIGRDSDKSIINISFYN